MTDTIDRGNEAIDLVSYDKAHAMSKESTDSSGHDRGSDCAHRRQRGTRAGAA